MGPHFAQEHYAAIFNPNTCLDSEWKTSQSCQVAGFRAGWRCLTWLSCSDAQGAALEAAVFVPAEESLEGGQEIDSGDEGEGTAGVLARMPGELVERELRLTYRSFFMSAIADMRRRLFTNPVLRP
jgi:hypothetical protein